jgi:hypothetical protein
MSIMNVSPASIEKAWKTSMNLSFSYVHIILVSTCSAQFFLYCYRIKEMFEDTKAVIRSRKSYLVIQHLKTIPNTIY